MKDRLRQTFAASVNLIAIATRTKSAGGAEATHSLTVSRRMRGTFRGVFREPRTISSALVSSPDRQRSRHAIDRFHQVARHADELRAIVGLLEQDKRTLHSGLSRPFVSALASRGASLT